MWFVTFCDNILSRQPREEAFTLNFATLWLRSVGVASLLLGVPDVVLHASAEWVRVGFGHVVSTALRLIQP
jgi:hypothetical protein